MFDGEFTSTDEYRGCVLCIHGVFKPGPYPQKVICDKFGVITEREDCSAFEGPGQLRRQP
jgi:hypothetical protein